MKSIINLNSATSEAVYTDENGVEYALYPIFDRLKRELQTVDVSPDTEATIEFEKFDFASANRFKVMFDLTSGTKIQTVIMYFMKIDDVWTSSSESRGYDFRYLIDIVTAESVTNNKLTISMIGSHPDITNVKALAKANFN